MNLNQRLEALARLGEHLRGGEGAEHLQAVMQRSFFHNPWFTLENQERALRAVAEHFLEKGKLENWASRYDLPDSPPMKTVGLVMAGNIPLVGFHDLLCTFAAGHKAKIKLSDKDKFLLPHLLNLLEKLAPASAAFFEIVDVLKDFDAVVATGSNNSARYFEAYFSKKPHVIRRNRNAAAVLDGSETGDELMALGKDVFRYFGMGCRSVSKLYLPQGYDFQPLLEALHEYRDIILHSKYKNNFDYNLAILLLNRTPHWNNGCVILTEDKALTSRIAMLHYEFFSEKKALEEELKSRSEEIQCIAAREGLPGLPAVPFGKTQQPQLGDYADGVDAMAFLRGLA